ncbi:GntR family transcriptional regulator [Tumebacillus avium]|uniref:GntR family transcriptional regulator n=1 Tax=Tumebacillus avium TaxID=1903704 RepID=A0A1Y0IWX9_9BACL|nr:GntR family transcriptional regulator [Tumebacillus avium]ARU63834.1 GntR family transcriptional regulator [Tumebacillus avium]
MRIPIQISSDSADPIYHQVETQFRELILSGQLPAGTALPSIRALAQDLGCSVITTRRVYQDLENEGLIRTRKGIGTFVSEVGTGDRDKFRTEAVIAAFRDAVEIGRRLGLSPDVLRDLFESVLRDAKTGEGE